MAPVKDIIDIITGRRVAAIQAAIQRDLGDMYDGIKARLLLRQPVDLSKEAEKVFSALRADSFQLCGKCFC